MTGEFGLIFNRLNKHKKLIENISIISYVLLVSVIAYYHEPWFDEAQSWLIARDENLFDIIWNVLRYEGHTPLWYIVLYLPSHLGMNFEISIKLLNILFASSAAFILVKKSPFPLIVRILLPFTYFIFYQYRGFGIDFLSD